MTFPFQTVHLTTHLDIQQLGRTYKRKRKREHHSHFQQETRSKGKPR